MQQNETNPQKSSNTQPGTPGSLRIVPVILTALGIYLILCFTLPGVGVVGAAINQCLLGLFGGGAYILPFLLFVHALFFKTDIGRSRFVSRVIFSVIALLSTSTLIYTFTYISADQPAFSLGAFYESGKALSGGGAIGNFFGFIIRAAIGQAGVIIFFAAILAAYAVYFFSSKDSASRRVLLSFLSKIADFFAAIEKFFRGIFNKAAARHNQRREKEKQDRDNALFADDFFAVDNGMKHLSVSGIDVTEERDDAALESHPVLHETVRPANNNIPRKPSRPIGNEYFSDYPLAEKPEETPAEESKPQKDNPYGLDESADGFFTKDFDPLDLATSEKLAQTRSSKAADIRPGIASYSDSIDTMTPERLEQAKRNAKFEESRRRAIENSEKAAAERAAVEEQNKAAADAVVAANRAIAEAEAERKQREERAAEEARLAAEAEAARIAEAERIAEAQRQAEAVLANTVQQPVPEPAVPEASIPSEEPIAAEPVPAEQLAPAEPLPEQPTVSEPLPTEEPFAAKKIDLTIKEPEAVGFGETYSFSSVIEKRYEEEFAAFEDPKDEPAPASDMTAEAEPENPVVPEEPATEIPAEEPIVEAEKTETDPTVSETVTDEKPTAEPLPEALPSEPVFEEPAAEEDAAQEPMIGEPTASSATVEEQPASLPEEPVFEPFVTPAIEVPTEKEEPVEQIRTERAMLNTAADYPELTVAANEDEESENAEEAEEISEDEASEAAESESYYEEKEIPPADQSLLVRRLREMYAPLREQDSENPEETEEAEKSEETEKTEEADKPEEEKHPEPAPAAESEPDAEPDADPVKEDLPPFEPTEKPIPAFRLPQKPAMSEPAEEKEPESVEPDYSNYEFPPIDLLAKAKPTNEEDSRAELQKTAEDLIKLLDSFHVSASIKGFDRGPRITRFEIVPATGVRVQTILNLEQDITLNLAAVGMRIESPIPGKSAMGFEIPNRISTPVMLRDLLDTDEFRTSKSKTYVAVGKDVIGSPVYDDFTNITHELVAGATGMGKSVFINSLIVSVLYKARPDEVRFIMIDPKAVEFTRYAGIPHLLIPVVTDPKQAAGALMWAVDEMNRRYNIMKDIGVKKIDDYNEKVSIVPGMGKPFPKILIFVDELNDLMSQNSIRESIEFPILQIVQKARAAGIHLIIGTQRPDVKVITGTIKANIPTRAACKVMSVVDSRTILDCAGAEKLLNKGDMLYLCNGKPRPIRIQGAFVSDDEVEKVMNFLRAQCSGTNYDEKILADINNAAKKCDKTKDDSVSDDDEGGEGGGCLFSDPKFQDAVDVAISSGKVSTSLLQRKIGIGYGKAAKYIDFMESQGIVGERDGMKPRDVKITRDEWFELLSRREIDN